LATEVTITADNGNEYVLPVGEPIFMDHHFGEIAEAYSNGDASVNLHEHHGHVTLTQYGEHTHEAELHQLTIHKYIEDEQVISGDDIYALWEARSESFTFGANMHENEYATQQSYANFFFFITGFHGFHVFSGVVINFIIFIMAYRGVFERRKHYEMVEKVGLYWHFIDLVWVFVFTFYYLI
jgi:hypothetical protein